MNDLNSQTSSEEQTNSRLLTAQECREWLKRKELVGVLHGSEEVEEKSLIEKVNRMHEFFGD